MCEREICVCEMCVRERCVCEMCVCEMCVRVRTALMMSLVGPVMFGGKIIFPFKIF